MHLFLISWESSIRLEEHIKLRHLQKLLQIFKSHQPTDVENNNGKKKKNYKSLIIYVLYFED